MTYNQQIIDNYRDIKWVAQKHPGRFLDVMECFSQNQYDCKTWLLDCLNQYPYHFKNKTQDSVDISILGGWYGLMAKLISDNLKLKPIRNIYSYDFDSIAIKIGRKFFPQVEFIEQDITELDIGNTSSSIIINTSCEHIDQEMLYKSVDSAPTNTLFVLQSNNFVQIQQHINCVKNLDEFQQQYEGRLDKVRAYEKDMGKYTRFMIIGVKK